MKTTIKEVENTFDEDNYIKCNEDGTFTVFTGTEGETFQTEAEAVNEWVLLWNEWHEDYCADSTHDILHIALTDKAEKMFDVSDPLVIVEHMHDCEYVYDLSGMIEANNLTEDGLNEMLESLYDQFFKEEEE
jgi:hypothetical protein